jgi:hypothetical protein
VLYQHRGLSNTIANAVEALNKPYLSQQRLALLFAVIILANADSLQEPVQLLTAWFQALAH